ncbi:integrase [Vibrio sp. F12]|nr:integrase [Vibrio sp. F12]
MHVISYLYVINELHRVKMNRNMNARNFGLRSSNMGRALITAYQLKSNGDNTKNQCKTALNDFVQHLKEHGVNDLKKVERSDVLSYAQSLNERFEKGELSASSAQNYLSKVNVAMENARLDKACRVEGVKESGLPNRTGIASQDHSVTQEQHNQALELLSPRLSAQLELQRTMGLRFKESSLIDAKGALQHAKETGVIKIEFGTKGGRYREFNINNQEQIRALERAAEIQGEHRSMIPNELSWKQYQNQCNREIQKSGIKFHGERHHYANQRYEALTGVKSPVRAELSHGNPHLNHLAQQREITLTEAKQLDQSARLQIAQELGHGRIGITNNYLG